LLETMALDSQDADFRDCARVHYGPAPVEEIQLANGLTLREKNVNLRGIRTPLWG
jgi:hypothetical protein